MIGPSGKWVDDLSTLDLPLCCIGTGQAEVDEAHCDIDASIDADNQIVDDELCNRSMMYQMRTCQKRSYAQR